MDRRGIIFDLDECLLHSFRGALPELETSVLTDPSLIDIRSRYFKTEVSDYKVAKGTGTVYKMWGVTRPHLKEFLLFCKEYFKVIAVWSAASYDYVHQCVDRIFGDIGMPDLVFTWDDIEHLPDGDYYKPITKILNHPSIKDRTDISWSFLLDDKISNFTGNEANGIGIPEYDPAPTISSIRSDDICLIQLRQWLMRPEVISSVDIRVLDKRHIFKTPLGLTPSTMVTELSVKYPTLNIPLFSRKPRYIKAST